MNIHIQNVAKRIKEINDYYKKNEPIMEEEELTNDLTVKVNEVVRYAEEYNVPIKLSINNIIQKVTNTEAGEEDIEEYEESSEYYDEDYEGEHDY